MTTLTSQEQKRLIAENNKLSIENKFLKEQLSSKRFRYATKTATVFNKYFPLHSRRRSALTWTVGKMNRAGGAMTRSSERKYRQKIHDAAKKHGRVIVWNTISWTTTLKQRPQHMAEQMSKLGYLVIYLEGLDTTKFKKINDSLIIINNANLLDAVPDDCKKYFFSSSTITETSLVEFAKSLNYEYVYEYIDEIHGDISDNAHLLFESYEGLEKQKPFLLLASAKKLYKQLEKRFSKNKLLLSQNAVNAEHFNYREIDPKLPSKMAEITEQKKPVVGFYGAIAPWLDYDLLNKLAKKRSDLSFVYIGLDYGDALKKLKLYDNVYFLGPKDYDELPNYSYWFDCAIIPFKCGEIAKSTSPVKLFEFMAMGMPTVCTKDLTECSGYDYVYMSKDATEFEKNIDKAIADKGSKKKRETLLKYALQNTWEQRAKDLDVAIKRLEKK